MSPMLNGGRTAKKWGRRVSEQGTGEIKTWSGSKVRVMSINLSDRRDPDLITGFVVGSGIWQEWTGRGLGQVREKELGGFKGKGLSGCRGQLTFDLIHYLAP
jgi:hypothetical protein